MVLKSHVTSLILLVNVVIYLMWGYMDTAFMEDHFVVSQSAIEAGRYWVLLSAAFSQIYFLHLFVNMIVLSGFGRMMEAQLGSFRYLRFYVVAAVLSSLFHIFVSAYIIGKPDTGSVGASGALAGVVLLFALFFPREKILVFGIIPVPAIFGAIAFMALDVWGIFAQSSGGGLPIGHGAHLGGAFTGIVYYLLLRRRRSV